MFDLFDLAVLFAWSDTDRRTKMADAAETFVLPVQIVLLFVTVIGLLSWYILR